MFFGPKVSEPKVPVSFMGAPIELVTHDKHLGNIVGQNSNKILVDDAINVFHSKVNMVASHFNHVQYDSMYHIFKTYCIPVNGSHYGILMKNMLINCIQAGVRQYAKK